MPLFLGFHPKPWTVSLELWQDSHGGPMEELDETDWEQALSAWGAPGFLVALQNLVGVGVCKIGSSFLNPKP